MLRLDKFDRYKLTFGPTPIEHLPRLTAALGGEVEIYAKRDDCNSGLAFGGNKLRKLEYIVPDAIASNADTLVSIGGVQSNHTRMVAATAAKIGMKCVVVQESWVPHEDAVYDRVGNILLTRLMGADSRIVSDGFDIGIRKSWEDAIQSVKDAGGKPYAIPAGAVTDESRLRQLSAFFFWTSWAASTNRPNDHISYTNNWPYEPLVANRATGDAVVWTGVSIIMLLAGISAMPLARRKTASSRRRRVSVMNSYP